MAKQTYYNYEWADMKLHYDFVPWIAMAKDNKHFCCKVCNNGSLKLGTMCKGAWWTISVHQGFPYSKIPRGGTNFISKEN